jgi:DNA helicase HerA-like ATPase
MENPRLYATVLLWLLSELFEQMPEVGDLAKPKLVFFFDEAHLLFDGATKSFLESIVQTVRLIRSKGVGVFFCTQQPKDVPTDVLAQLGNRVQYALRAFTPDDAKALKATVSTFPRSDFYDLEELLTQLAIGEAVVTILSESGVPTPVVHTRIRAPRSKMAAADSVDAASKASLLYAKYGTRVDAQSAREMLAARIAQPQPAAAAAPAAPAPAPVPTEQHKKAAKAAGGGAGAVGDFLKSTTGRQVEREVVRGLFGLLSKSLK